MRRAAHSEQGLERRAQLTEARRTPAGTSFGQRRRPNEQDIDRGERRGGAGLLVWSWSCVAPGDLVEHPQRAVKQRREHQADTQRGGDRPPAAVPEDPRERRGMAGREQALQKLLGREDRDQAR